MVGAVGSGAAACSAYLSAGGVYGPLCWLRAAGGLQQREEGPW